MWKYCIVILVIITQVGVAQAAAKVITFTQTGCQFLESEAKDYGFKPKNSDDCKHINATTDEKRLAVSQVLQLPAGSYIVHVSNRDVTYKLGFWLRGQGLGRLTFPSVSGGGIQMGQSKDYPITLKAGRYHYSCPLNPTPNYTLIVK